MTDDQTELQKVEAAIAAQQALLGSGVLPDAQIEATLAALHNRRDILIKQGHQAQAVVKSQVTGDVLAANARKTTYIINVTAEAFWQQYSAVLAELSTADLQQATKVYLTQLVDRYQYLDFKGMGVSDRVPLRMPLLEMYVPLKARIEMPEGDTWSHQLRLAGRQVSQEEAEAMGQRLSEPQPLVTLLGQHDGLIILGDPGAGKTTFLKVLTLRLALGEGEALGLGQRLPILVPLSAYANALDAHDIPLDEFVATYYRERGLKLPIAAMLSEALAQGGALLLLDGLDEIRDLARRQLVMSRLVDFFTFQRRQGNKFILTSRIVGYRDVRPTVAGLAECTLVDFDHAEITQFVNQWTAAVERAARGDTAIAAAEAARERSELLASVERNPGVRQLAANPLLLTILALMKRQGITLPERRVELYQKYVETLLRHWNLARGLDGRASRDLDVVETTRVLAPLALWMHQTSPGVGLVKREAVRRKLEEIYAERGEPDPEQAGRQLLSDAREYASLLLERGAGMYGFIHLTFQEYLAAVAIAQRGQQDVKPVVQALADHIADDNWHEVSLLAIGYLGIVQQRDEAAGMALRDLIQLAPGEPGQATILAGEAALDAWPGGVTPACKKAVIEALQTAMVDTAVSLPRRAKAGQVLGRLGDPRAGVTTLPPLLTPVLEGEFLYGDSKKKRGVKPFQAGIYPITNSQFAHFIEAGGYNEATWWSREGWQYRQQAKWTQPRLWDDSKWNIPNHPVVGISWFEAEAFCNWLSAEYGQAYRLPAEAEWERLVRGQDGREFPWGDRWQDGVSNTIESRIGQTSAVGMFPAGVSPSGAYDCAGNVWEWGADWYYEDKDSRVLRGGAWDYDLDYARCSYRSRDYPSLRVDDLGFRLVVSPI
ncbi:MAG: SUMF1/EgtB/PvdO family nonheme iron enzyme [Anaerolineae bacterium]|nr:SUMF1/EgtB/PvdO family nonheme iron enzyme [Anaerolineae bacterium]